MYLGQCVYLGSGLIDQSQKQKVAAMVMAELSIFSGTSWLTAGP